MQITMGVKSLIATAAVAGLLSADAANLRQWKKPAKYDTSARRKLGAVNVHLVPHTVSSCFLLSELCVVRRVR